MQRVAESLRLLAQDVPKTGAPQPYQPVAVLQEQLSDIFTFMYRENGAYLNAVQNAICTRVNSDNPVSDYKGWLNALDMASFWLAGLQEPQHPLSPVPQSLLLVAKQWGWSAQYVQLACARVRATRCPSLDHRTDRRGVVGRGTHDITFLRLSTGIYRITDLS